MDLSEKATSDEHIDTVEILQTQLADCRAQLEHWQGVATICELSKQEELGELQRQCDQEIQSLQEALRETASQYEARISTLQSERAQWRKNDGTTDKSSAKKGRGSSGTCTSESQTSESPTNSFQEPEARIQRDRSYSHSAELESEGTGLIMEGYFSQHCDSASLSSFSLDTPSLLRRPPPQDDTASLVSTGTLVPEAIYLPPPGHRLVTHSDWDALNSQVVEQQGELSRLREEREQLERELETQTAETQKQVSVLQFQVQTSEGLLQELQKSFSQSQNAVESRLSALSLSQRRMCNELSRLKGEEVVETDEEGETNTSFSPALQGPHCEERLRIEIVNLKEQLDTRAEESEVLEAQLSSLKTETEHIQYQKEGLQVELQGCRTELQGLRVALSHLQGDCKTLSNDKAAMHQQCLELRSQVISLRSQVDTSQTVQRDFVQLSQSLQVKLELIRQAETLDQVRQILGEGLSEDGATPTDAI